YTVICDLKRDDMRELVPKRAAPVEFANLARGGAVHRYHLPEANAERAQARKTQRAHGEVFVIGKHFNRDRRARREAILCGELLVSVFKKVRRVDRKRAAFLRR